MVGPGLIRARLIRPLLIRRVEVLRRVIMAADAFRVDGCALADAWALQLLVVVGILAIFHNGEVLGG